MNNYLIKNPSAGKGYWKEDGKGYVDDENEAGIFADYELQRYNLDGCFIFRTEREKPINQHLHLFLEAVQK